MVSALVRVGDRDAGGRLALPNLRSDRPFLLTEISSSSSDDVAGVRFGPVLTLLVTAVYWPQAHTLVVACFLLLVDRIVLFS